MLLIVDLECTCDEKQEDFQYEIIEIGAAWVDGHGNILHEFQSFVKPTINSELTHFCKQMTGIKQSEVDSAETFEIVSERFDWFVKMYQPGSKWASWGASDRMQIEFECERYKIKSRLLAMRHRNLKKEFAKQRKIKQVGVKMAIHALGLDTFKNSHRAIEDVRKIVAVTYSDYYLQDFSI